MNLEQTIEELEKQAAQYTEAANSLRALLQQGEISEEAAEEVSVAKVARKVGARKNAPRKAAAKAKKPGSQKAAVSAETRAKISEALRASHAARKAQAE